MPFVDSHRPERDFERRLLVSGLLAYAFFWAGLIRVRYDYIDDIGRSLWGTLGWEDNGRPLATLVMQLFTRDGQLVSMAPLLQWLAVGLMALTLVVLRRQLSDRGGIGWMLCALPLFATPTWLENMAYQYDSLYMALAVLCNVAASMLLWAAPAGRLRVPAAIAVAVLGLCLYQPAFNVFLALGCLHGALRSFETPAAIGRSLVRLGVAALMALGLYFLISRLFLPDSGYSSVHAATLKFSELVPGMIANFNTAWWQIDHWSGDSLETIVKIQAGVTLVSLVVAAWRRGGSGRSAWWCFLPGPVLFLALTVLALYGPMLVLANPVWKPRTFMGLGGMLVVWWLLGWQLAPWRVLRGLSIGLAVVYLAVMTSESWLFGNALARESQYEARLLGQMADEINQQYLRHDRRTLVLQGEWPWPRVVARARNRDPLMMALLPPGLSNGSYWNKPALNLHGMVEGVTVVSPARVDADPSRQWQLLHLHKGYRLEASGDLMRLIMTPDG